MNRTFVDCGGKRSATPLLEVARAFKSGAAAALCHRSPKGSRPQHASDRLEVFATHEPEVGVVGLRCAASTGFMTSTHVQCLEVFPLHEPPGPPAFSPARGRQSRSVAFRVRMRDWRVVQALHQPEIPARGSATGPGGRIVRMRLREAMRLCISKPAGVLQTGRGLT